MKFENMYNKVIKNFSYKVGDEFKIRHCDGKTVYKILNRKNENICGHNINIYVVKKIKYNLRGQVVINKTFSVREGYIDNNIYDE